MRTRSSIFSSRQHNYPPVVIQNEPPSKDALKLLSYETAKQYMAFPLRMAGNTLQITMSEPTDAMAVEELQNALNKELSVCVSTEKISLMPTGSTTASTKRRRRASSWRRKSRTRMRRSPRLMTSGRSWPRRRMISRLIPAAMKKISTVCRLRCPDHQTGERHPDQGGSGWGLGCPCRAL